MQIRSLALEMSDEPGDSLCAVGGELFEPDADEERSYQGIYHRYEEIQG